MPREEETPMTEVRNLNKKRIGDVSKDIRVFEIQIKDCVTKITANADGTLNIMHERIKAAV